MNTRAVLSALHADTGNPEMGASLWSNVFARQQRVLGPDHPSTLESMEQFLRAKGKALAATPVTGDGSKQAACDEMVKMWGELCTKSARALGSDDPRTTDRKKSFDALAAAHAEGQAAIARVKRLMSGNGSANDVRQEASEAPKMLMQYDKDKRAHEARLLREALNRFAQVIGVTSRPELNGNTVELLSFIQDSKRYTVRETNVTDATALTSSDVCASMIKPLGISMNLRPENVLLRCGMPVVVSDLLTAPELNGRQATVEAFAKERGRYLLKIEGRKKEAWVKTGNCVAAQFVLQAPLEKMESTVGLPIKKGAFDSAFEEAFQRPDEEAS